MGLVFPAVAVAILATIVLLVDYRLVVDEEGKLTLLFNCIFMAAPVIYGAGVTMVSYFSMQGREEKTFGAFILGIYPSILIVFGELELFLTDFPLFCYTITAGFIFIYVTFSTDKYTTDALTGLKFRPELDGAIAGYARKKKLHEYTVFMIDMNGLKALNDVYGHVEGDNSLRAVARGMQDALRMRKNDGAVCRFGGDEFLMVVHLHAVTEAEGFLREMRSFIARRADASHLKNVPQIAAGYQQLGHDLSGFDECLRSADERMYINKRKMESENRRLDLFKDEVTGLPNANYFHNAARGSLDSMMRENCRPAIVFFDIVGMHAYNDRFGYNEGNRLLKIVGNVLSELFPSELVVRYTEDHFVVMTTRKDVKMRTIEADHRVNRLAEGSAASLRAGIYFYEDPTESVVVALDKARRTKNYVGEHRDILVRVYDEEIQKYYERRDYVLSNFDEALAKGWIKPYYQAHVRTLTGRICSSEALARWEDPEKGLLSPAAFIPVLESTHRILELDLAIIRQVCETIHRFQEQGQPALPVSVNLSQLDFQSRDIFEAIESIRREYEVPAKLLMIEITESALASSREVMQTQINKFRKAGYSVWMDDFGSGNSSLTNLNTYHFDLIKIDMSFVQKLETQESTAVLLLSMVNMAKRLGVHTLCEGVETREQYEFLRSIGCERIQGYFVSKPLSIKKMMELVHEMGTDGYEREKENAYYEAAGLLDFSTDPTLEVGDQSNVWFPMAILELEQTDRDFNYLYVSDACKKQMERIGVEVRMGLRNVYVPTSMFTMLLLRNARQCMKEKRIISNVSVYAGTTVHIRMRQLSQNEEHAMFACTINATGE